MKLTDKPFVKLPENKIPKNPITYEYEKKVVIDLLDPELNKWVVL